MCKPPPMASPLPFVIKPTERGTNRYPLELPACCFGLLDSVYSILDADDEAEMVKFRQWTGTLLKKHGLKETDAGSQGQGQQAEDV